jgi:hypothetical protein
MQHQKPFSPFLVFCVASPSDATLLAQWETHLLPLQQASYLTIWSELHLPAGAPRTRWLHQHLEQADIIVLLMSASFFASDECIALMEHALQIHEHREVCVIPLLLRPVAWEGSPLALLSCLPSNKVPVTEWTNLDAALRDCVQGIIGMLGQKTSSSPVPRQAHESVLTTSRILSTKEQLDLADILQESLVMSDRRSRETVLELLPGEIFHSIRRFDSNRMDIVNIIRTCTAYASGLETLIQAMRSIEGNSLTLKRIDEFVKSLPHE